MIAWRPTVIIAGWQGDAGAGLVVRSGRAMLADYVLSGTTYLERYDLTTHWVTWSAVGLRQPVVKPLFGQPAEYETVAALGRRLGLRDATGKEFFRVGAVSGAPVEDLTAWYEEYLPNELVKGGPAMTLDQLKALPGAVCVDPKGTHFGKYASVLAPEKLATASFDGDPAAEGTKIFDKPKDQGGKRIGTVLGGKPVRGFFTPSGKVEFVSPSLAAKPDAQGRPVSPLPVYTPRDWQPDDDYPLFLINWKEASHTHTRTQDNPWLLEVKPANPLVIHPETARRHGIGDDDEVIVESRYGRFTARARLPDAPRGGRSPARLRAHRPRPQRRRTGHRRRTPASHQGRRPLRHEPPQGMLHPNPPSLNPHDHGTGAGHPAARTSSIHPRAAIAVGNPAVDTASTAAWRMSSALTPAASAFRVFDRTAPSASAPMAIPSFTSRCVAASRPPAASAAAPSVSRALVTSGYRSRNPT